jgi:hypothetical protein
MSIGDRFTKVDDELVALGLPPRLVMLYGRIVYHAGEDGLCYPTHKTLAKEIGLTSRRSRQYVLHLLKELRRLRLIEWKRGRYSNGYRVLTPDVSFLRHQMSSKSDISDVSKNRHRKESSSKEAFKRTPRAKPPRKAAAPPRTSAVETPNTKTQEAKTSDDDEPKAQPQPLTLSSAEEFRAHLRHHHGPLFDVEGCLVSVQRQLQKRGLAMSAFLAYYAERTTSPSKVTSVRAYCTQLAKDMVAEAAANLRASSDEILRKAAAAAPPEPPRNDKGRCAPCDGVGKLANGAYCTCALGRGLEKLERREAQAEAKKGPATETQSKPKVLKFPAKGAS